MTQRNEVECSDHPQKDAEQKNRGGNFCLIKTHKKRKHTHTHMYIQEKLIKEQRKSKNQGKSMTV